MKKNVFLFLCILSVVSIKGINKSHEYFISSTRTIFDTHDRHTTKIASIRAEQENSDGSTTVIENNPTVSAPCKISFYGSSTDPDAYYYIWHIYLNNNTDAPIARYTDQNIKNYTFDKSGNYTVELEVTDKDSQNSEYYDITFTIDDSDLDIPNYFSPNSSPGQNDEFRVKHKSLIKFKCTIFNRWGVKLYQWDDPDKGWDGKYKGKMVKPGVYFYVIEATGADGTRHKKMGDINIL